VDTPHQGAAAAPTPAPARLLRRERDALKLASHGLSPQGIALVLRFPVKIVEEQLRRSQWRLGTSDVVAAVLLTRRCRLIE
jgi:DNA-binding NarL/FixJ family response regulator